MPLPTCGTAGGGHRAAGLTGSLRQGAVARYAPPSRHARGHPHATDGGSPAPVAVPAPARVTMGERPVGDGDRASTRRERPGPRWASTYDNPLRHKARPWASHTPPACGRVPARAADATGRTRLGLGGTSRATLGQHMRQRLVAQGETMGQRRHPPPATGCPRRRWGRPRWPRFDPGGNALGHAGPAHATTPCGTGRNPGPATPIPHAAWYPRGRRALPGGTTLPYASDANACMEETRVCIPRRGARGV